MDEVELIHRLIIFFNPNFSRIGDKNRNSSAKIAQKEATGKSNIPFQAIAKASLPNNISVDTQGITISLPKPMNCRFQEKPISEALILCNGQTTGLIPLLKGVNVLSANISG